ncbi:HAD family hydrolase [Actinokineospora auranticolor]|uniref:Phosphoglycolate phosphatase n=1 Tax=Actinokineospora auranticolor TaxID=155976 RepID=A0A2S6GEJ7_9PSEU|nr:HAD family hydrolase [Actinokineospora auranticolor]PPK63642.1 phosphoglycolate phosphatase [Actinokineospora auranticolor]
MSEQARQLVERARAVVFDLDDTLVMTRVVKWAQHQAVAARFYGITLTEVELAAHWGKPFDELISLLYRDSAPLEEMRAANLTLEPRYRKPVMDGARDVVDGLLDRGAHVGVVTSANTGPTLSDLDWVGFPTGRLRFVHGADATAAHKPDPAVFDDAIRLLAAHGVGPAETVYVGDSIMDLHAARGAGLGFVGVTTGQVRGARFAEEGACWVAGLAELVG